MEFQNFRDLQGVCVQKGISFFAIWEAGVQDGRLEVSYPNGVDSDAFRQLVDLSEFSSVKIDEDPEEDRGIRVIFR